MHFTKTETDQFETESAALESAELLAINLVNKSFEVLAIGTTKITSTLEVTSLKTANWPTEVEDDQMIDESSIIQVYFIGWVETANK